MDDNFYLIGKQSNFTAPQFTIIQIDYGELIDDLLIIRIVIESEQTLLLFQYN